MKSLVNVIELLAFPVGTVPHLFVLSPLGQWQLCLPPPSDFPHEEMDLGLHGVNAVPDLIDSDLDLAELRLRRVRLQVCLHSHLPDFLLRLHKPAKLEPYYVFVQHLVSVWLERIGGVELLGLGPARVIID